MHSTRSGGTTATTDAGSRVVPVSIRATRSGVGDTTGSPSVQPRSNIASVVVFARSELDAPGPQPPGGGGRVACHDPVRVGGARPAAGPVGWQVGAEAGYPGERLPLLAAPPDQPVGLPTGLDAHQGRDGVDVERERHRQVGVVDRAEPGRERRVVLGVHGEGRVVGLQGGEDRDDQLTGRAVALDDGDQPVGQRHAHVSASTR